MSGVLVAKATNIQPQLLGTHKTFPITLYVDVCMCVCVSQLYGSIEDL